MKIDDETFNRWKNDFIDDINVEDIEYITVDERQLQAFIMENYLDKQTWRLVSRQLDPYRPIGLTYLTFDNIVTNNPYEKEKKYILGVCTNKKGTKTILSILKYIDNYVYSESYSVPQTFLCSVEVNEFFRQRGLCGQIMEVFARQINKNNPLLLTEESVMGRRCKTINMVKGALQRNGFDQTIRTFGEFTNEYYHNQLQMLLQ